MNLPSFTATVKEQICRIPLDKRCDTLAEVYGFLMFATAFHSTEIRHMTEQNAIARRIQQLFRQAFGIRIMPRNDTNINAKKLVFQIEDTDEIRRIFNTFGLEPERSSSMRLNRAVLEEDCCRCAFLRGAFLASGSVADPSKRYHLELVTPHLNLSREFMSLLQEMELEPKVTTRKANYVIYFKFSERIENFLTLIGASNCALQIMAAKVEKEVRNQINRQVNCEAANISKTVSAAGAQIDAIRSLENVLPELSEELQIVARARLEYPDYSLTALAETFDPPMRRATLNYRLQRLISIANEKQNPERSSS
ncbi:MAG: DNA-binding protein WhiA [Ruminococcaceae bacterium]|nr:DNA-binding protein WhiA [Oscillospiraceae bacterium]